MNNSININASAVVQHANRLERIGRSALPVAVRQTLNRAAFDTKQKNMPIEAGKAFEKRQPNFFKANSKVTQANGFAINSMKAVVGFVPLSGTNKAVDDLEQQEHGGDIGGRSLVPLRHARSSKSWGKRVRSNVPTPAQIKGKIIDARRASGRSDKEKFIKSAIHAGVGGFVMGTKDFAKGRIVFQIKSIVKKNGRTIIKQLPLYSAKKGRDVSPKASHFMQKASEKSRKDMNKVFIEMATKQLNRVR